MKSILFLMAYPLEEDKRHLTQKFDAQMEGAEKIGLNVWYTAYGGGKVYLCTKERKILIGNSFKNPQNILQSHKIFRNIKKIFNIKRFEYCYIRSVLPIPSYLSALKTITTNNCRIIVEIPTYPVENERRNSNKKLFYFIISILEKLNGKKVPKYVDLYTIIGASATHFNSVPAINIQNGVNIDAFPIRRNMEVHKNEIHLLALACMSYWHGYDRVIEGLKKYYNDYQLKNLTVYLHMVGNAGDDSLEKWEELVKNYKLDKYVYFEGFKTGEELNRTFEMCDIALGSLGLYRENLETASSIKVAEYCARGIPFIYAGNNNLLKNDLNFCMKVPNNESVIDINKILEFACSVKDNNIKKIMREYAKKNMTWEIQIKKVMDHFGEV